MTRRKMILMLAAAFPALHLPSLFSKSFDVLYTCSFAKGNKLTDFHQLRGQWHDLDKLALNFASFKDTGRILNCQNLETEREVVWLTSYSSRDSYLSWKEKNHAIFNNDKALELGFKYNFRILS